MPLEIARVGLRAYDLPLARAVRVGGAPLARAVRAELPRGLSGLADRAERLHERVRHLDRRMYVESTGDPTNPVRSHMDRLKTAFGG